MVVAAVLSAIFPIVLMILIGEAWFFVSVLFVIVLILSVGKRLEELKVLSVIEGQTPTDTAACAECGRLFETNEMVAHRGFYICASCKPIFLQKIAEGANFPALPGGEQKAFLFWPLLLILSLIGMLLALVLPALPRHHP